MTLPTKEQRTCQPGARLIRVGCRTQLSSRLTRERRELPLAVSRVTGLLVCSLRVLSVSPPDAALAHCSLDLRFRLTCVTLPHPCLLSRARAVTLAPDGILIRGRYRLVGNRVLLNSSPRRRHPGQ